MSAWTAGLWGGLAALSPLDGGAMVGLLATLGYPTAAVLSVAG